MAGLLAALDLVKYVEEVPDEVLTLSAAAEEEILEGSLARAAENGLVGVVAGLLFQGGAFEQSPS